MIDQQQQSLRRLAGSCSKTMLKTIVFACFSEGENMVMMQLIEFLFKFVKKTNLLLENGRSDYNTRFN